MTGRPPTVIRLTLGASAVITGNEAVTASANEQAQQGQAELRADERPEEQTAAGGVVAQVAEPGDVALQAHLPGSPDDKLAAIRAGLRIVGAASAGGTVSSAARAGGSGP